jgi:hypothetical protein
VPTTYSQIKNKLLSTERWEQRSGHVYGREDVVAEGSSWVELNPTNAEETNDRDEPQAQKGRTSLKVP